MAKQVGPREHKPRVAQVLRARTTDEAVLGEIHQGPQACRPLKAGYKTAAIPCFVEHEKLLANREASI